MLLELESILPSEIATVMTLTAYVDDKQQLSLGKDLPRDTDTVVEIPTNNLRDVHECTERDLFDIDGDPKVATDSSICSPRRYNRTSTSSGYSSYSPPLSAAVSYSCCPASSAYPAQNILHASMPVSARSHLDPALAVIHESDTSPRSIWPRVSSLKAACYVCRRYDLERPGNVYGCGYSTCHTCMSSPSALPTRHNSDRNKIKKVGLERSSRKILLKRLSRRLNITLESDNNEPSEEILQDIARTLVARDFSKRGERPDDKWIHGERHRNSRTEMLECECNDCWNVSSSSVSSPFASPYSSSPSSGSSASSSPPSMKMNRHNFISTQNSSLCSLCCSQEGEQKSLMSSTALPSNSKKRISFCCHSCCYYYYCCFCCYCCCCHANEETRRHRREKNCLVHWRRFTMDAKDANVSGRIFRDDESAGIGTSISNYAWNTLTRPQELLDKTITAHGKRNYVHMDSTYSLEYNNDERSDSSQGIVKAASKQDWCIVGGFNKNLDFTLDSSKAERLGHAIAKSKRRRQWCRALTAILGLVVFLLSVVVVSLSVTKGRKVFGSM